MTASTPYLTRWLHLRARKDTTILGYLRHNPGAEAAVVAADLQRNVLAVKLRLHRLEEQGLVSSRWETDEAFFYHTYFINTEEHHE